MPQQPTTIEAVKSPALLLGPRENNAAKKVKSPKEA
jgi:hypothetical protein